VSRWGSFTLPLNTQKATVQTLTNSEQGIISGPLFLMSKISEDCRVFWFEIRILHSKHCSFFNRDFCTKPEMYTIISCLYSESKLLEDMQYCVIQSSHSSSDMYSDLHTSRASSSLLEESVSRCHPAECSLKTCCYGMLP